MSTLILTHTLLADQYLTAGIGDPSKPVIFERGTQVEYVRPVNGDYIQVAAVKDGKRFEGIVRRDKLHKAR